MGSEKKIQTVLQGFEFCWPSVQRAVWAETVMDVSSVIGVAFKLAIENSLRGELAFRNLNHGSGEGLYLSSHVIFKQVNCISVKSSVSTKVYYSQYT